MSVTTPVRSENSTPMALWLRYRWIVGRIALGLLILLLCSILVYAVTLLLPGDAAQAILGRNATPERVAALRQELGLDLPPLTQYLNWVGGAITGDFGTSLVAQLPVTDLMLPRLGNTLVLLALAALIGFPLALVIGVSAAVKPRSAWDAFVNTASIVLSALPEFVVAILLVVLFSTGVFHWLPGVALIPSGSGPLSNIPGVVLPVTTLVILVVPYLVLQVRASLIESLDSEYVVMAQMKGLPRRTVITRHALRNALVPYVQAAALILGFLLGGTVVIETLFQFPGIGFALVSAVSQRDIPVLQFIAMVMAAGYIFFNLLADVLTVLLTPKLRTR